MVETHHDCPIRGHQHKLLYLWADVQVGTGVKFEQVECPTGRYRWMIREGLTPEQGIQINKPNWAWRKDPRDPRASQKPTPRRHVPFVVWKD